MKCTYMGMAEGTSCVMGDGGILIGPRGAGEQAEEQEERNFEFLLDFISSGNDI